MSQVSARDKQKAGAQISLFGSILEEQSVEVKYPNIPEYETMERLSKEKSVLGVYVSGHPFEKFLPYFKDKTFNCNMLNAFTEDDESGVKTYTEIADGQAVTMGGMISAYKKLKTRTGSFMAFVTVEDLFGSIECVCFPKVYDRIRNFMEADRVVSITGKISIDAEKAPVIIVERMDEYTEDSPAPSAPAAQPATPVVKAERNEKPKTLWLNITGMDEADKEELLETLTFYEGDTPVIFVANGKKFGIEQRVEPNRALFAELAGFLPESCIKLL
jgi:DNA polymerase III alpha subunit